MLSESATYLLRSRIACARQYDQPAMTEPDLSLDTNLSQVSIHSTDSSLVPASQSSASSVVASKPFEHCFVESFLFE